MHNMTYWYFNLALISLLPIISISHHVGYSVTFQIPGEGRDPSSMTNLRARRGPCSCQDGFCSCCTGLIMQQLNQRGCVNLEYEPDDFALNVKVQMNDKTIYKNSVSGKNPQPICVPMPRLPALKLCVKFTNVYLAGRNIHACIDMEGHFFDANMFKLGFDCMRMGADGVALLKPEDGGGIPDDYDVPDDGPDYDIEGIGSVESTEDQTVNITKIEVTSTKRPVTKVTTRKATTVKKIQTTTPSSTTKVTLSESNIKTYTAEVKDENLYSYSYDINKPNSKLGNVVPL